MIELDEKIHQKTAFTLAEVLITLGIIGIVAALTMPILLNNVQGQVKAKRIENIRQKLSKVTDKMAVQSGLTGYGDTAAFVQELQKHMKIAKVCDNNHLNGCWPTKEVILNADGIAMILSYNKSCDFDVDKDGLKFNQSGAISSSTNCISGVYDWNGGSKPNKLGQDVLTLGMASGLDSECAIKAGGTCFTAPFQPTPLSLADCLAEKDKLGIKKCTNGGSFDPNNDYWAGAVAQCGGVKNMPTTEDLTKLAKLLYNTNQINSSGKTTGISIDKSQAASIGYGVNGNENIGIWSGYEAPYDKAGVRTFYSDHTYFIDGLGDAFRDNQHSAMCVN